jgi:hypothetical protein
MRILYILGLKNASEKLPFLTFSVTIRHWLFEPKSKISRPEDPRLLAQQPTEQRVCAKSALDLQADKSI